MAPLTNLTPWQLMNEMPYGWGRQIITHWFELRGVRMFRAGWQSSEAADAYRQAVGNLPPGGVGGMFPHGERR